MTYLQRTLLMACNKHEMMATFSVMSASAFNYVTKLSQKYFPYSRGQEKSGVGWGWVRWVTEIHTHKHVHSHTHKHGIGWEEPKEGGRERGRDSSQWERCIKQNQSNFTWFICMLEILSTFCTGWRISPGCHCAMPSASIHSSHIAESRFSVLVES